jgi:hypothetical protein
LPYFLLEQIIPTSDNFSANIINFDDLSSVFSWSKTQCLCEENRTNEQVQCSVIAFRSFPLKENNTQHLDSKSGGGTLFCFSTSQIICPKTLLAAFTE